MRTTLPLYKSVGAGRWKTKYLTTTERLNGGNPSKWRWRQLRNTDMEHFKSKFEIFVVFNLILLHTMTTKYYVQFWDMTVIEASFKLQLPVHTTKAKRIHSYNVYCLKYWYFYLTLFFIDIHLWVSREEFVRNKLLKI